MLEKIGLPAKPSLRGNNWVVDASHCQGCASPFTFINRKHHCRRCGGLFCNNCTLLRMVLRGQGDSPVRICEPCKKLVEAERFELRHGHRTRAGQGRSKMVSNDPDREDEILTQVLRSDAGTSPLTRADTTNMDSTSSTASGSSNLEDACVDGGRNMGSISPEELRRQALDEKKRYKILKEGWKPEEALRAFKKGKELERQADALELSLRKGRKKTLHAMHMENIEPDPSENTRVTSKGKRKDDLLSELKELGWSDQDLHSADKKPEAMSLEGELSTLIREINQKPSDGVTTQSMDRTAVTAHKRKALMLKREGNLAEAKEELKKAKLLEKQIEEEELLGGAEDSDDELSALMRSVDADKEGELSVKQDGGFHVDDLIKDGDSMVNFDVTDDDMQDPQMADALKSLGWEESHVSELSAQSTLPGRNAASSAFLEKDVFMAKKDAGVSAYVTEPHVDEGLSSSTGGLPRSRAGIQRELLSLKRKALALRREGKTEEAEEVLAAAKALEAQITDMEATKTRSSVEVNASLERTVDAEDGGDVTENDLQDPSLLSMLKDLGWNEEFDPAAVHDVVAKPSNGFQSPGENAVLSSSRGSTTVPRGRAKTQRELLTLKRKALDLRRKGEIEEAEKVLLAAKELEKEIEEIKSINADDCDVRKRSDNLTQLDEQERHGDMDSATKITQQSAPKDEKLLITDWVGAGKFSGKDLADQGKFAGFSSCESVSTVDILTGDAWSNTGVSNDRIEKPSSVIHSFHPSTISNLQESKTNVDISHGTEASRANASSSTNADNATQRVVRPESATTSLEQEILALKKKAVAFKREGKIEEAREELKRAKLLERSLEDDKPLLGPFVPSPTMPTDRSKEHESVGSDDKPFLSSRDRFKIQQESLAHKRQALKLRKEGKIKEAESELELAKALESQLEESASHESRRPTSDGVVVEDLLDPELLSALKAIGIADTRSVTSKERAGPSKADNSGQERSKLEEEIKAEKLKAVRLKRAGKQAEALDSMRQVKLMEKKLNYY